ncbi:isoprenylcysteine carboxyl methyltransferase [Psychromonas sp. psych-6C06]|uniref:isoprenylcysteine carboxylmethyltransferase family protein n=1 Tax=Psychromonas sp. psych-6C06 TaxID=2058089 RepID=UPI000C336B36|nr:isoprenylcysteine carboxylmethyltransferase family protein [Psychromonas sp. psych-6C06]PKF61776.1 isoprenylcysteine carboxyl methyltransferase [Psychromonas sp. psych-6C06]
MIECPKSPTSMRINAVGLLCSLSSLVWLRGSDLSSPSLAIIIASLSLAIPIIFLESLFLKSYKNSTTGLDFKQNNTGSLTRTAIKLVGFYACLAFVALVYWLFPEYRGGYYDTFFNLLKSIFTGLCLVAIPYFYFVDRMMVSPKDGYWQLGAFILGRNRSVDWSSISQLLLGWTVKLFFLPLMFKYSSNNLNLIVNQDITQIFTLTGDFSARYSLNLYQFFNNFLFYIDLLFVTVGYCFTVRLFDAHIRSTEPTFFGWFIALICYQPFWGAVFGSLYISYNSGRDWSNFFWDLPLVHFSYGALILFFVVIYVWASMAFGIRFSNLTHRGILTNGPFRYTKHPAYIAKNISWWLIFMPFLVAPEFDDKLRLSFLLLLQNVIYFLRARTEEKHLSADENYVRYAQYIEQHGLFAWVGHRLPIIKFKRGQLFNSQ